MDEPMAATLKKTAAPVAPPAPRPREVATENAHVVAMPAVAIPGIRLHAVPAADLGQVVDRLGHLQAIIAQLCDVEADLKAMLRESGEREIDGSTFRATVSEAVRTTLDTTKIRTEMGDAWCAKFERRAVTNTLRVTARKH